MQERIAILLSRKLSGEATEQELVELTDWVKVHQEDHYLIETIESYWQNHSEPFSDLPGFDNSQFERILKIVEAEDKGNGHCQEKKKDRKSLHLKSYLAAAVIVGICLIGYFFLKNTNSKEVFFDKENTYTTSLGTKSHISLPDGSKVWLNAATKLQYKKDFNSKLREVYLTGEAYFDVRKDAKHPFIVHTSDIDIRVLGTVFNVKSYNEDAAIETTLIHGSIKVISNKRSDIPEIVLHPNEKLVYAKNGAIKTIKINDVAKDDIINLGKYYQLSKVTPVTNDSNRVETAWVQNRLLFDGHTFRELAIKMERWFNVKINFENEDVASYRLRGAFEEETIDEALKALQQIANFKYIMKDKTVTIYK